MGVDVLREVHGTGEAFLEAIASGAGSATDPSTVSVLRRALEPDARRSTKATIRALRRLGTDHVSGLIIVAASRTTLWGVVDVLETLDDRARFTPREREVLGEHLAVGRTKLIETPGSTRTVEWHLRNLQRRLELPRMHVARRYDHRWTLARCLPEPSRAEPSRAEPSRAYISSP